MLKFFLFSLALMMSVLTSCRTEDDIRSDKAADCLAKMERFYRNPDLDLVAPMILEMHNAGILSDDVYLSFSAGFFSRLFALNSARLESWFEVIDTLPHNEQGLFLIALRWADTEPTNTLLHIRKNAVDDDVATFCRFILTLPVPDLLTVPLKSDKDIPAARGAFCGGAEEPYFNAVLGTAFAQEQDGMVNRIAYAARVSLRRWAENDAVIRHLIAEFEKQATPRQKRILQMLFSNDIALSETLFSGM